MAWRITEHVIRGEIDNRIRGRVTGHIWLSGVEGPLILDLEGDCGPDLAGCLLTFENRAPVSVETRPPAVQQLGRTGDITASRKVRVPDVPVEEFLRLYRSGKSAPEHLANALYIEWFSELSGRVVIESTDFRLHVSPPEWRLTPEQDAEREQNVNDAMEGFLEALTEGSPDTADEEGESLPWDEFRHEQALRESDALTDKFGKLLEKYRDHPDRDRLIAQEMGWDWIEEVEDEQDEEATEEEPPLENVDLLEDFDADKFVQPNPDPAREGIDWIRTSDGEIRHPLHQRAFELVVSLDAFCRQRGLLEDADGDLAQLLSKTEMLAAKLAGALADLAEGTNLYEPGFVVALLKRALEVLNWALATIEPLSAKSVLPRALLATCRSELLGIREGMLTLIQQFRKQIS